MIKNRMQLIDHGFIEGRKRALEIATHALQQVDPRRAVHAHVALEGDQLRVDSETVDLAQFRRIYAIGAGKATYPLAVALEDILGDRISDGLIAVKTGQSQPFSEKLGDLSRIRVAETAHPIPDESSLMAAEEIRRIARRAGQSDLVFCLMSGGISSQAVLPVEGITLADKIRINRLLVHCGADVTEIMTVRRHLSRIKGGRLVSDLLPATVISLTVSDEKSDAMEWNTDWTSPDSTTLADAVSVLERYDLWDKVSPAVRTYLSTPTTEKETPKDFGKAPLYYCMVVKTRDLWQAAVRKAEELGLKPVLLTTVLNGESREVGRTIASIAREIQMSGRPFQPPCALIATGETAVRIERPVAGIGGANQELAAGACLDLNLRDSIVVCALDTDGTDGPTSIAGALTDGWTIPRATEMGHDFYRTLRNHDVTSVFSDIGDAVITGPTGTNVNDLVVCVVL